MKITMDFLSSGNHGRCRRDLNAAGIPFISDTFSPASTGLRLEVAVLNEKTARALVIAGMNGPVQITVE